MSVRTVPDRHGTRPADPEASPARVVLRWLWPVALTAALVSDLAPVFAELTMPRRGAAVVLAVLTVAGALPRQLPILERVRLPLTLAGVVGGSLLPLVAPSSAVPWTPYVAVAFAATVATSLRLRIMVALLPVAAIVVVSWAGDRWLLLAQVFAAAAVFVLLQLRSRARENAELAAAQHEVIIMERARLAAAERQREVAAEVHDVLAHTLSGLIITLQGAGLTARAEGASTSLTDQLAAATTLAKDGLVGARRAVESLHRAADAAAEQSATELPRWIAETVERLRAGADAPIEVHGDPATVPSRWADLVRATVLEGLTNSMRHAVGRPIMIMITGGDDGGVRVLSVGRADRFVDRGHASGGYGLTGLAERVTARGGTLTYGPCADGYELVLQFGPDGRTADR